MIVEFAHCLVLESRYGQSQAGNAYCVFRFLDEESCEVYDLIQFGDGAAVASGLARGVRVGLTFELRAARDGGLRAELCGVSNAVSIEG